MSYCERCTKLIAFTDSELGKARELWERNPTIYYTPDYKIGIVVSLDCPLCALIFDTIPDDKLSKIPEHDDPHLQLEIGISSPGGPIDFNILFTGPDSPLALSTINVYAGGLTYNSLSEGYDSDANADKHISEIDHTPETSTDSEATWSLVQKWLASCNTSHEKCVSRGSLPLPTRLLSIGSSDSATKIRLVESSKLGTKAEYCTLSHCWGKIQITTLQRSNYDEFLKGIEISSLPKTFRDAIHAAIQLGFQYIWIDSLCIVQNDAKDWEKEALMMSSVYSGSALNLAATSAANGQVGLFFNRNKGSGQGCRTPLPLENLGPRMLANDRIWEEAVEKSPLASRGWVTQERFLAPRTLHFTSSQIFWECREFNASESFPNGQRTDLYGFFHGGNLKSVLLPTSGWRSVVQYYCSTLLTKEEDKLIAMSGVAMHFQSQTHDQYLAGLWLENIETQLLWQVRDFATYNTRPSKYRAPSWSWAALDGKIGLQELNTHSLDFDGVKESVVIRVVDVKIQPTIPSQPFGQIQSASLKIECAPLKRTFLQWSDTRNYNRLFIQTEAGSRRVLHSMDVGDLVATDEILLMLVLYTNSTTYVPVGLMLQSTGRKGEYKRVGRWYLFRSAMDQDVATLDEFLSASAVEISEAYCHIERSPFRRRKLKYYITLV